MSIGNVGIDLIQIEAGDEATDFEYRPIGEDLALCQRYYQTGNSKQQPYVAGARPSCREKFWLLAQYLQQWPGNRQCGQRKQVQQAQALRWLV